MIKNMSKRAKIVRTRHAFTCPEHATGMGATIKMFSQDTVMKRVSQSTLKLWRKQDREKKRITGTETMPCL
jgi:hypothetical protein